MNVAWRTWVAQEALIGGWLEALDDNSDGFAQVTVRCGYRDSFASDRSTRYARNVGFFSKKSEKVASKDWEEQIDGEQPKNNSKLSAFGRWVIKKGNDKTINLRDESMRIGMLKVDVPTGIKALADMLIDGLMWVSEKYGCLNRYEEGYGMNRKLSPWDFVPVVGSIKQIVNGAQDTGHGARIFGAVSIAAGLSCPALDDLTIASLITGVALVVFAGRVSLKASGGAVLSEFGMQAVKLVGKFSGCMAFSVGAQAPRIASRFKLFRRAKAAVQESFRKNAKAE